MLSSAKAVRDIVDRSGWSASDRPPNFLVKQATDDHHMGFMRYGMSHQYIYVESEELIVLYDRSSSTLSEKIIDHGSVTPSGH